MDLHLDENASYIKTQNLFIQKIQQANTFDKLEK
jgi:hypothetical protein